MKRLTVPVCLLMIALESAAVYPDPGFGLNGYTQDKDAFAVLMPFFRHEALSALESFAALSPHTYQQQHLQEAPADDQQDGAGAGEGEGEGVGVGGLDLGEAGPTYSSHGYAINSYGHSGSGSSDWVPIRNPHY